MFVPPSPSGDGWTLRTRIDFSSSSTPSSSKPAAPKRLSTRRRAPHSVNDGSPAISRSIRNGRTWPFRGTAGSPVISSAPSTRAAALKTSPSPPTDYPAHLHVNLAPQFRNRGIGAMLIEAFAADAHRAGAKGMHVVTSADARNVRFYERVGFRERARTSVNGSELVFLGRSLADICIRPLAAKPFPRSAPRIVCGRALWDDRPRCTSFGAAILCSGCGSSPGSSSSRLPPPTSSITRWASSAST